MKIKEKIKPSKHFIKRLDKFIHKPTKSKRIVSQKSITVRMRSPEEEQRNPLQHRNIYFQKEYEQEKRNLFLS